MRHGLSAGLLAASVLLGGPAASADVVDTTPPAVSLDPDDALEGAAVARFNEPVHLVTTTNFIVQVAGTATPIPTSLRCYGAGGARTACEAGDVRKAVLSYAEPLLAGQAYTAVVNPEGAPPVVDAGGNAASRTTEGFRASVSEQETSPGAVYRWDEVSTDAAFGGAYRRERARGAKATYWFTGASVTWYTVMGPHQGRADVYVDGERVRTVDNYSSSARHRVARTLAGLAPGEHRLTILVRGEHASRSRGSYVSVDSFAVEGIRDTDPGVRYRLGPRSAEAASGDEYVRSDVRGARATFRFRGKGIDWYTVTGPHQGKAAVYVDGDRKATFDNYDDDPHYRVRRGLAGLSDAEHTITVRVLGERDRRSGGSWVSVDRWVVRLPSTIAFKRLGAWIDLYDYGLDPADAVAAMDARGVRTIFIQTARYSSDADIVYPSDLGEWIERAHAAGIRIVGWYLPAYDQYLDRDVRRSAAAASFRSPGGERLDAVAIDIEYKGATESLDEFNDGIRSHLKRVRARAGNSYPIGAIVPAPLGMAISPSSWKGFPWSSIGRYADAVLPMAYWSYRTDCPENPDHCPYDYARINISKAKRYTGLCVHIVGGVGNAVSTSEVSDFVRGARDGGAYGGSLYDYRTTSSSFWAPLADFNDV